MECAKFQWVLRKRKPKSQISDDFQIHSHDETARMCAEFGRSEISIGAKIRAGRAVAKGNRRKCTIVYLALCLFRFLTTLKRPKPTASDPASKAA